MALIIYAGNVKLNAILLILNTTDEDFVGTTGPCSCSRIYMQGYIVVSDEIKEDSAKALQNCKRFKENGNQKSFNAYRGW